jgi:hypothetical protein
MVLMSNSIYKLLSILLAAVVILSGVISGGMSADAKTITPARGENVFFYALNSEGKSVLLKVIPLDDLKALQHGQLSDITSGKDTGRDYDISGIDVSPATQYCEAKGFTIPELINQVKKVTAVGGADQIAFGGKDTIRLMATDSYGTYNRSWTYDDLYGVKRFYFEGLYDRNTGWKQGWEVDPENAKPGINLETYNSQYRENDPYYHDKCVTFATGAPTAVILATESFSTGTAVEASSEGGFSEYVSANGGQVSGCAAGRLNDSQSLKLLIPMSEADLMYAHSTASYNFDWIYNLRLDMCTRPSVVSQGTVAHPQAELSLKNDNMTITISCTTPGAALYYSFDGAPQIPYAGPISLSVKGRDLSTNPVALYMTAVKEGWDDAGIINVNCPASPGLKTISADGTLGYAADTLTIKVGYFGGPYYLKHVFTLDELKSMDVIHADYTFLDNMPSVVIDHVEGVRLSDIMSRSGIDLGSVQTFYFWTKDVTSTYYTSFPKTELIETPRYCYYSLPDNFDNDKGMGNEQADDDKELVDTVIALADNWERCLAGATFGSDYLNLNINTRFRLVYGQKDTQTTTASRSAKWIHSIVVQLGGAPTLTINTPSVLDLNIGSLFHSEASIKTADQAISENAKIEWSSSNEKVASVDSEGNITVHSEGKALITASFAGATTSFIVNGSAKDTSAETGITEVVPQNPSDPGDQYYINPEKVPSKGDAGGVQNWRVYEMSESSSELPDIKEKNPLMPVIAIAALVLFLGAVIYRIVKFKFDMGGGLHVFRNKSK